MPRKQATKVSTKAAKKQNQTASNFNETGRSRSMTGGQQPKQEPVSPI